MDTSLDDLIHEMEQLKQQIQKFESKYKLKWSEFYRLVQSGKIEESFEFHEWLGLIKLLLSRQEEYQNLIKNPSH